MALGRGASSECFWWSALARGASSDFFVIDDPLVVFGLSPRWRVEHPQNFCRDRRWRVERPHIFFVIDDPRRARAGSVPRMLFVILVELLLGTFPFRLRANLDSLALLDL